jgi:hypothetical protein
MVHIRRDIWCLESASVWDPITLAYAEAVADMQRRPVNDPTSWAFQAGIHGSYAAPPPGATWNQCQHASWYFLSWHRMYLYWFERIVRAAVIKLKGHKHKHWALPYWNYSKGFPSNTLPPAFRQPTLPGGAVNALYVADPNRNTNPAPGINGGAQVPAWATSFATAFADTNFSPPPFPGFGGGQSPPVHFGPITGDLENTPHNIIHVLVGGSGWMGDPNTAAQDPIFWLHHANIDRLWSHWLESGGGRADPSDVNWLTQQFPFYDENGAAVMMSSQDVIHTVRQLKYRYEDEPPPSVYRPIKVQPEPHHIVPNPPEELLAASNEPIELDGPAQVTLRVSDTSWRTLEQLDIEDENPPTIQLWVEGIEFSANPGVIYEIFLNLPKEVTEEDRFTHLVGFVTFFGMHHGQMDPGQMQHGQMAHGQESPGMTEVFNLTNLIAGLNRNREFEEHKLDFEFAPLGLLPPPAEQGETTRVIVKPAAKATIRRLRVTSTQERNRGPETQERR